MNQFLGTKIIIFGEVPLITLPVRKPISTSTAVYSSSSSPFLHFQLTVTIRRISFWKMWTREFEFLFLNNFYFNSFPFWEHEPIKLIIRNILKRLSSFNPSATLIFINTSHLTIIRLLDERDSLLFKQLAGSIDVRNCNSNVSCQTSGRQTHCWL